MEGIDTSDTAAVLITATFSRNEVGPMEGIDTLLDGSRRDGPFTSRNEVGPMEGIDTWYYLPIVEKVISVEMR